MANYNKVILIGNLTRDPQLSYLPNQTPVVEIGLAVNRRWRGQDNQQREETCFIDCRAYGRTAETIKQYCAKGESILIEGRLQLDTWEGKDGVRRSKHRVFVERFQFLGRAGGGAAAQGTAAGAVAAPPRPAPVSRAPAPAAPAPAAPQEDFLSDVESPPQPPYEEEGGGEEIPF